MALLSNHRRKEPLPNPGVTKSRACPAPAGPAPPPHLTLELTLLLEAEVFWGVSHHGEGLLGVVSAGQEKKNRRGVTPGERVGTSGLLLLLSLGGPGSCPIIRTTVPATIGRGEG